MLFANFGTAESAASMKLVKELRAAGIAAEVYPDSAKMKKQIGYANALGVPFFAIIGESELADGTVTVKNMESGEQKTVPASEVASIVG